LPNALLMPAPQLTHSLDHWKTPRRTLWSGLYYFTCSLSNNTGSFQNEKMSIHFSALDDGITFWVPCLIQIKLTVILEIRGLSGDCHPAEKTNRTAFSTTTHKCLSSGTTIKTESACD